MKLLVDRRIERVLSSPYVRCVETVQPLADKLGLRVESAHDLAEGANAEEAMALVRRLTGTDAVLCSHGDVIPSILDALTSQDRLELPPGYPLPKGSTWDLTGENGTYMAARYIPPPA